MDKELLEAVVTGFVKCKDYGYQKKEYCINLDTSKLVRFSKKIHMYENKREKIFYYFLLIKTDVDTLELEFQTEKEMVDFYDFIHKVIYLRGLRALKNS